MELRAEEGTEGDRSILMLGLRRVSEAPYTVTRRRTAGRNCAAVATFAARRFILARIRRADLATDGVAPRAKMNQQCSRHFRSAQEAKDKEAARAESILLWEAMGKEITDLERKEGWDQNAITPGTPFMELLATLLRHSVVQKINTDPGWKNIQVLISDASVPGEGGHKIMDFIRRQRSNTGHDPNKCHDADLIMLGIATHEPQFWVLREDAFADANSTVCRKCRQEGHYAAQCTAMAVDVKTEPDAKKKHSFSSISPSSENISKSSSMYHKIVLERAQIILELAQREDEIFRRRREARRKRPRSEILRAEAWETATAKSGINFCTLSRNLANGGTEFRRIEQGYQTNVTREWLLGFKLFILLFNAMKRGVNGCF
ncbi:XRN 5'-3' exonuclease N-terminus-domain-containing protein [Mycena metata]|uniref:XRN 5'-3' exonuclease N-terminus-domain-containing protein n=1 Tax=Mycena metata TaxID=1033252 RepID=A0AAD7NPS1_9AGAR|nr:XRN 5'-3' exonuclease N-terminus-domain-containing protein [Mycena metata]